MPSTFVALSTTSHPNSSARSAAAESVVKNPVYRQQSSPVHKYWKTDGNPLEIQTQVTELFILGRQVSTDNKHQSLYEKYRARPRARVIS